MTRGGANDDAAIDGAIHALRGRQLREAGRGCLLALVLEGAALLAGALWIAATVLDLPRLSAAGTFGFVAFTLAAAAVGLVLLFQGNLPRQRRLRRAAGSGDKEREGVARAPNVK